VDDAQACMIFKVIDTEHNQRGPSEKGLAGWINTFL
jgi:hypothetical protein